MLARTAQLFNALDTDAVLAPHTLTAVSVAALTMYDLCKAVDRGMRIEGPRLVRKSGGKVVLQWHSLPGVST